MLVRLSLTFIVMFVLTGVTLIATIEHTGNLQVAVSWVLLGPACCKLFSAVLLHYLQQVV